MARPHGGGHGAEPHHDAPAAAASAPATADTTDDKKKGKESIWIKIIRQLGRRAMPKVAQALVEHIPEEMVDHASALGWIADVLGITISDVTPDTGLWGLGDDVTQDFFRDIGAALENRKKGKTGGHGPAAIADDEKQYVRIVVASMLVPADDRVRFWKWFNGLSLAQMQAFLRIIAGVEKEQVGEFVKSQLSTLNNQVAGYIHLHPEPAPHTSSLPKIKLLEEMWVAHSDTRQTIRRSTASLRADAAAIRATPLTWDPAKRKRINWKFWR